MAEAGAVTDAPPVKKGGMGTFVRKNKVLVMVVGAGGLFYLYKKSKENSAPTGEEGQPAVGLAAAVPVNSSALSENNTQEVLENELQEIRNERQQEREANTEKAAGKNEGVPPEGGTTGGGGNNEAPIVATPQGSGITVNGKSFPGANGSHIRTTGTVAGKHYIEYVISFPGRKEDWRYFTATGNWRKMGDSATGPGSNKKPAGKPAPHKPPKIGVGPGKPAAPGRAPSAPAGNVGHGPVKNAEDTGVSVNKPRPKVPSGWTTYRGSNGHWWKKPK